MLADHLQPVQRPHPQRDRQRPAGHPHGREQNESQGAPVENGGGDQARQPREPQGGGQAADRQSDDEQFQQGRAEARAQDGRDLTGDVPETIVLQQPREGCNRRRAFQDQQRLLDQGGAAEGPSHEVDHVEQHHGEDHGQHPRVDHAAAPAG